MQSTAVIDQRTASVRPRVRDLLVLWQHPGTGEIIPIGRFDHDEAGYTFAYTRAIYSIDGFRPLPGLEDLHRRYDFRRIPPVFDQRVMHPGRPDYSVYLTSIGLDPASATPWEQIVESGGTRAGDTLQFMQMPMVTGGRAVARFFANGVRRIPDQPRVVRGEPVQVSAHEQEQALAALRRSDTVSIEPEDDNPVDPFSVLILAHGTPIGWVPRAISPAIRRLLASGPVSAVVDRVGPSGGPPHMRLVITVEADAPPGFRFDADGSWEPLSRDRTAGQ